MIDRRTILSAALTAPITANAQSPRPRGKIGYIHQRTIVPDHITLRILGAVWRRLGYAEGDTVLLRAAEGDMSRVSGQVRDLIDQGADVLIVVGADAVKAAARTTSTVPIVAIDFETDPVRSGLAASFSRPGANVTGLFMDQTSLAAKWIDLLFEAAPNMQRVAILWDPTTGPDQRNLAVAAAQARGMAPFTVEISSSGTFDLDFASSGDPLRTGIVQLTSPGASRIAPALAETALKHRMPSISFLSVNARVGFLMSYGPIVEIYYPRAVEMADRILKGAKASEMPIESPDRYEFVINLKTAKALSLALPSILLFRADEVIE